MSLIEAGVSLRPRFCTCTIALTIEREIFSFHNPPPPAPCQGNNFDFMFVRVEKQLLKLDFKFAVGVSPVQTSNFLLNLSNNKVVSVMFPIWFDLENQEGQLDFVFRFLSSSFSSSHAWRCLCVGSATYWERQPNTMAAVSHIKLASVQQGAIADFRASSDFDMFSKFISRAVCS